MNANMGTQPRCSSSDNSTTTSTSSSVLLLDGHEGVIGVSSQHQYGTFSHSSLDYGQFNLFEKVGLVQPMVKDTGDMFDHHNSLYGNMHSTSLVASDSNLSPPTPPRVYKPCVVCSDKSSGYHYGVSSCEGCKGFFRRSIQKNMQYTCHKEKNCVINKVTRNRCQYCRLQKCVVMGMSKEAVRNDRNKKRKQKPESTSCLPGDVTGDEQMLLQEVLEAHKNTTQNAIEIVSSSGAEAGIMLAACSSKEHSVNSPSIFFWEKLTEVSSTVIASIVNFAERVPGFLSLSVPDQITLLKAACLEIIILRVSMQYDVDTDTMQFSNALCLTQEQLHKEGFGPLAPLIFSFAASLKRMNCDDTEYALLSSICLISGDRFGLEDVKRIDKKQESLLEALKHYVRSQKPEQKHLFAKMLMKLTDLRSITVRGEKQMSPHALDCVQDMLRQCPSPAKASVSRDRMPSQMDMSSRQCSETVTSATFRPCHVQEFMVPGLNLKPVSSMSASSIPTIMTYSNGLGNGCNDNTNDSTNGSTISDTVNMLFGSHSSVDGRNYSALDLLGSDLEAVIPSDFTSRSTLNLQPESSDISNNMNASMGSFIAYGNGRTYQQNSHVVNLWDFRQEPVLPGRSTSNQHSSSALEVIVKPVNQSLTDLIGSTSSFNRSPNSEAPSSGPLSSPSFLAGMHHHQYPSPSPDLNVGPGVGTMYSSTSAVTSVGQVYSSVPMSLSSPYTPEHLLYTIQPELLVQINPDFIQGHTSSSSSATIPNFLSMESLVTRADQHMLPSIHQPSEASSLEERLHADLLPSYTISNNMRHQVIDHVSTSSSIWDSQTREDSLIYRAELMMTLPHHETQDIARAAASSDQPSVDSTNDSIVNMTVPSSTQDNEDGREPRSSSSMSISQLIGGAMKIEPDDWIHYNDPQ